MAEENEGLFNLDDYVAPGGDVPEHLKGKSAAEIAQYYSSLLKDGETKFSERSSLSSRPAHTEGQDAPPSSSAKPRVLTESDVAPVMGTMVQSAKMVARASLNSDQQPLWDRFAKEIGDIMTVGFKGNQLADANNWIFAFNQVIGSKAHTLIKETREAEAKRTSESSSPPPHEEEKETPLTPLEAEIGRGLGLGAEGYASGKKTLSKDLWPFTFSNTNR